MELNYFEGVPSPAGAGLSFTPLIYELSDFKFNAKYKKYHSLLCSSCCVFIDK